MALVITFKTVPNNSADRLWLTNKTGEYDAVANPEGFGAPNHELAQSGIVTLVLRNASAGDQQLLPVSSAASYDPGAQNSDETEFEFFYVNDGTHDMYMWRIPVSSDGITDVETNALALGDYFYHSINLRVEVVTASGSDEVTDYSVMVGVTQTNFYEAYCQDIFSGQSKIKRAQEYRDYQEARSGNCAEDPLFMAAVETTMDVMASDYTFTSGLIVDAQNQVETLLDEKDIDDINPAA